MGKTFQQNGHGVRYRFERRWVRGKERRSGGESSLGRFRVLT